LSCGSTCRWHFELYITAKGKGEGGEKGQLIFHKAGQVIKQQQTGTERMEREQAKYKCKRANGSQSTPLHSTPIPLSNRLNVAHILCGRWNGNRKWPALPRIGRFQLRQTVSVVVVRNSTTLVWQTPYYARRANKKQLLLWDQKVHSHILSSD